MCGGDPGALEDMFGLILKTALVVVVCLVAADIVGVLACTLFDILPLAYVSAALFYAIWFVDGVFCGLFAYNIAGAWSSPDAPSSQPTPENWSARRGARRIGTGVLVTALMVVAGIAWLSSLIWSQGAAGEYYVPDSESHSIVFFVAVLGAMAFARFSLMSDPGD